MSDEPPYYLVAVGKARSARRHVKHLPDEDSDDPLRTLCQRERSFDATLRKRRADDPIIADWRLCYFCDPEHDATPTGGNKELHNLLASDETKTLDDVREAL